MDRIVHILGLGLIVHLGATEPRVTLRDEISRVLKETFVYDESIRQKHIAENESFADEEVQSLPAFVVSAEQGDVVRVIAESRRKKEEESFDWRNGGTILKKKGKKMTSELKFSDSPEGGIEFFKFSW